MTSGEVEVRPATAPLTGTVEVPGDKSIAHRAVLLNGAARGRARVRNVPTGADVRSSMQAMAHLGAGIEAVAGRDDEIDIEGCALAFQEPRGAVDCGNSGTTIRLLAGMLAGGSINVTLDGDASLRRRPMARVADPLAEMGARIETTDGCAPLVVHGRSLKPHVHRLRIASAQVKTALLLAGLQASGTTVVEEPYRSRDHTERMLAAMGVPLRVDGNVVSLDGPSVPEAVDVDVPGDPSSAAFLAVAALLVPGSEVTIANLCLNPTRTGFVPVLARMGADVTLTVEREVGGEPVGTLTAKAGRLGPFEIDAAEVPATIDELPVLAVAAACAEGVSRIRGAAELRVKESDRIASVAAMLGALGAEVTEHPDGMDIHGGTLAGGASVETAGDHRLVMCAAVAALVAREPVRIVGSDAVAVSFPGFFETLEELKA